MSIRSSRRLAGLSSTGRKTIEARTRRIERRARRGEHGQDRSRHAVSGVGAGRGGVRRHGTCARARHLDAEVPQSARLCYRQLSDGRRPAVRRRAGDGDAGRAADQGAGRGAARHAGRGCRALARRLPVAARRAVASCARGKARGGAGVDTARGTLRGRRRALAGKGDRPRSLDRRFCRVGRRIAGAAADRCDRASFRAC